MRGEAATPKADEENFVVLLMWEEPELEQAAKANTALTSVRFRSRVSGLGVMELNSFTLPCSGTRSQARL